MTIDLNTEHKVTSVQVPSDAGEAFALPETQAPAKKKSWLFDTAVYAGIVNTSVFLLSVFVTYKTNFGNHESRWFGWLRTRGDASKVWTEKKLINWLKLSPAVAEEGARQATMVLWSFLDGSLLAPVAAWLETKRPKETKKEAEAQRSLGSLLAGRFITAGIVVPTAVIMNKTGWNAKLLEHPGQKIGKWASEQPLTKKLFPKMAETIIKNNKNESMKFLEAMGHIGAFEIFYTSVCTLGLWLGSKWIANVFHHPKKSPADITTPPPAQPTHTETSEPMQPVSLSWADKTKTSSATKIMPKESFVARAEESSSSYAAPAL